MAVVAKSSRLTELVDPGVEVEQIATGFTFTEGPVWHPDGYLLFSDMPGDVRRKWSEDGGIVEVMKPSNKCNGLTLDADLNLIVCEHWTSELVRASLNADGTEASREVIASHYEGTALNSPNDVVVKSDGSIYFSDPKYGQMDVFGNPRDQELSFQGVYRIPRAGATSSSSPTTMRSRTVCASLLTSRSSTSTTRSVSTCAPTTSGRTDRSRRAHGDRERRCRQPRGRHPGRDEVRRAGERLGEHVGNLNWGGPEWNVLYVPSSTSVYRFSATTRGAPASYMR